MLPESPVQCVEAFHLVFLRLMEARVDRGIYVVKGGVNLRAWFGSPRYSQDLDVDAIGGSRQVLEEKVDKLLATPAFLTLLRAQGIVLVRSAKPKQTDTTQRWKLEIRPAAGSVPFHTKVEFSRRGGEEEFAFETVRPEIVRPYGIPAPSANHTTARGAIRQKIGALAGRAEPQARDIWDLDHLFRTTGADPRPLPPGVAKVLPVAVDRLLEMPFEAFRGQVVPFLEADVQDLHGTPQAWERMRELVVDRLLELGR